MHPHSPSVHHSSSTSKQTCASYSEAEPIELYSHQTSLSTAHLPHGMQCVYTASYRNAGLPSAGWERSKQQLPQLVSKRQVPSITSSLCPLSLEKTCHQSSLLEQTMSPYIIFIWAGSALSYFDFLLRACFFRFESTAEACPASRSRGLGSTLRQCGNNAL